ncbi:hypothetical protein LguiA_010741 [Lonicera macranthoides]
MDSYEATKVVFSRIQSLDPENASKIMGLLLIQDHGEKEMIRLAFGPDSLLHSVILKARTELGISSNTSSAPSTPSSPSPFNNPISLPRQGFNSVNLPSPLSIPTHSSSSWANSNSNSNFSDFQNSELDLISPSSHFPNSKMNSSAPPFYGTTGETDFISEFELQNQLSFLNEGTNSPNLYYQAPDSGSSPTYLSHRRSCSVSDINIGCDDSGFGWKPCLYFARGYCKNGTSCRFVHGNGGGLGEPDLVVGSPSKAEMMEQCHELFRSKSAHQQRLVAASHQLLGSASFPYSPVGGNKMNFLLQHQPLQADSPRAAAALMMNEELHKFGRTRLERNDFPMNGGGIVNPGSRQIYLTFPADSTFREEDVSNYFSIYGPVQDVRIPYQQKRMFGFVTFVYPETVKLILAKGNPHFVCDARVLVKPYKEKGKVPDKFRKQQQMDRGEFSACGSPTGLDSRDSFDLGTRMFYNSQDMWRRKLEEQADLEQAIEFQSRRLMGLQLLDVKRHNHHCALSPGAPISSPTTHSPNFFNRTVVLSSVKTSAEVSEENASLSDQQLQQNEKVGESEESLNLNEEKGNDKSSPNYEESDDLQESLEHNLPDNLFASPKAAGDYATPFSIDTDITEKAAIASVPSSANNNLISPSLLPATSTLDMASLKSCYFHVPRFASGPGAIGL